MSGWGVVMIITTQTTLTLPLMISGRLGSMAPSMDALDLSMSTHQALKRGTKGESLSKPKY